jgi:murein DD-endopeptidase MepM/ murein hydrolase activator NlpD
MPRNHDLSSSLLILVSSVAGCVYSSSKPQVTPALTAKTSEAAKPLCERIGNRHLPHGNRGEYHVGVDFNACAGKSVIAIGNGRVSRVALGDENGKGDVVIIDHSLSSGALISVMYAHVRALRVRPGDEVRRGQTVGDVWIPEVGRHGFEKWTPHVHLALLSARAPVEQLDPLDLVKRCLSEATQAELVFPVDC